MLAWQVRLQRIIEETNNMRRETQAALSTVQMYQQKLISKGMESELDRWEALLPQDVSASRTCLSSLLPRCSLPPCTFLFPPHKFS